jgi:hypothetical protein
MMVKNFKKIVKRLALHIPNRVAIGAITKVRLSKVKMMVVPN